MWKILFPSTATRRFHEHPTPHAAPTTHLPAPFLQEHVRHLLKLTIYIYIYDGTQAVMAWQNKRCESAAGMAMTVKSWDAKSSLSSSSSSFCSIDSLRASCTNLSCWVSGMSRNMVGTSLAGQLPDESRPEFVTRPLLLLLDIRRSSKPPHVGISSAT